MRPEEPEDMWAIYNLISEGDLVRTTTFRKVVKESATGSTTSSKIRLNLTIQVERVQFDPDTCVLRLSGRNREESEHVKVRKENDRDAHSRIKFRPAFPITSDGGVPYLGPGAAAEFHHPKGLLGHSGARPFGRGLRPGQAGRSRRHCHAARPGQYLPSHGLHDHRAAADRCTSWDLAL